MKPSNHSFSRFRRFITECLGTTSTAVPAFLIIACLAVFAMFSNISCVPPTPPTPYTRLPPTVTDTPIPTATQTPTPTLHPPVTLVAPEEDTCVDCGTPVVLGWSWPHGLEADECYQLRLWGAEQTSNLFSLTTTEDQYDLSTSNFPSGAYNWAVAVVNSITHKLVSQEPEPFQFHIAPPPPIVHSILPTSTLEEIGVPVAIIKGENFTDSVALTISVPLQATYVNSGTLLTTIPMTLEAGRYPVTVQDLRGRGEASSVFFTVEEPPTVTPPPTVTSTPPCRYPPPILTGISIMERNVTFRWTWSRELAQNEWFAVRVGKLPDYPHSQYWAKEREYTYSLCTLGGEPGDYIWEVAICRGEPTTAVCNQCAASERQVFSSGGWPCE